MNEGYMFINEGHWHLQSISNWDLSFGCGPIISVAANLIGYFFHRQVMGRGQMGEMKNPSYGLCSSFFFIKFTSAYSKLVFRLCLDSEQLDLFNEYCAFGAFRFFSVSILAPVLDQAKADLIVIASSGVRLMTRNKRGTSVPLFLPINLRSSKITRTIERMLSL